LVCKELTSIAAAQDISNIAGTLLQGMEHKMLEGAKERGIGTFFKKLLRQF
jgi:hypothetical protein